MARGALLALPGLLIGFALISWMSTAWLELGYGILLLFFGFNLLWPQPEARQPLPLVCYPPLAGILSALIHGGGPLIYTYCRTQNLNRMQTVATMAAIHFINNISKGLFFGFSGLLLVEQLPSLLPACLAAIVGTRLGRTILQRHLDERLFSRGVGVMLLLLAVRYLLRSLI